jgi:hypothetical protein
VPFVDVTDARNREHGELSIENDLAERMLRAQALGRPNRTFFGGDRGGRTAAVLISLTGTCKALGVEPLAYLRDVLDRISAHPANRIEELLPDRWQALWRPTADQRGPCCQRPITLPAGSRTVATHKSPSG